MSSSRLCESCGCALEQGRRGGGIRKYCPAEMCQAARRRGHKRAAKEREARRHEDLRREMLARRRASETPFQREQRERLEALAKLDKLAGHPHKAYRYE